MVVRTIEMLLEYICIVLCIHRIAREKIKINCSMVLIFLVEWALTVLVNNEVMSLPVKLFIYLSILIYTKRYVVKSWINALKVYAIMTVVIFTFQLIFLYIVTVFYNNERYIGTIINILICIILLLLKEEYWKGILKRLNNTVGLVIIVFVYILNLIKVLILCNREGFIIFSDSIQIWIEMVVLSVALIVWFNEEQKNRHKEKELQMYEMYNQTFEETINTIRMRQHEFENHINAIKCMKYTIHDPNELLSAQEQYCDEVLKESKINDLLKLRLEPALIGFLHAKITTAQEAGIFIEYYVEPISVDSKIKMYEMIELIGVLFDNAIEALSGKEKKKIILRLLEDPSGFVLEVANISHTYSNTEIEQFCTYGYSTKGSKRGVGLNRVREIVKKANATLLIQNQKYNEENYLCFKVYF